MDAFTIFLLAGTCAIWTAMLSIVAAYTKQNVRADPRAATRRSG